MDKEATSPLSDNNRTNGYLQQLKQLKAVATEYCITHVEQDSITIIAPHGGNIEPHTSEIAALIAADTHNLFCFNGLN